MRAALALSVAALMLAGCNHLTSTAEDAGLLARTTNEHGAAYLLPARPLIPNASLQLTASRAISLDALIVGAAAYYFVDPLAPNWSGEVRRLTEDTYHIALRMKRFKTGGDGEGAVVFTRNADALTRASGYDGYSVLSLTHGIESETLGAVRVSEGVIRVSRAPAPR